MTRRWFKLSKLLIELKDERILNVSWFLDLKQEIYFTPSLSFTWERLKSVKTYGFVDRTTKWCESDDWWSRSRLRLCVLVPIHRATDRASWDSICCFRLRRPRLPHSRLRPFFVGPPMSWCASGDCKRKLCRFRRIR